jgi:DNA-binding response OmpR family regulator
MMTVMDGRPRLLVVEDDAALRSSLLSALSQQDFEVRAQADGATFAEVVHSFRPDLALLDVSLPGDADGFDLAATLATSTSVPFLFITAADALPDRLRGFELGADDYLVKPFSMSELLARIRAVLRRSGRLVSAVHVVRDLVVDESEREVMRAGARVELTHTEFEVLAALARQPGQVMSKVRLMAAVWGFDEYDRNIVEVHVSALRRKLEVHGPRLIHTVRGAGYSLGPPGSAAT